MFVSDFVTELTRIIDICFNNFQKNLARIWSVFVNNLSPEFKIIQRDGDNSSSAEWIYLGSFLTAHNFYRKFLS